MSFRISAVRSIFTSIFVVAGFTTLLAREPDFPILTPFHPEISQELWKKYEEYGYYTYTAEFEDGLVGVGFFLSQPPDFKIKDEDEESTVLSINGKSIEWIKRTSWDKRILWEGIQNYDLKKMEEKAILHYLILTESDEAAQKIATRIQNLKIKVNQTSHTTPASAPR